MTPRRLQLALAVVCGLIIGLTCAETLLGEMMGLR